ncbi:RXT2-like protein [Microdochium trichocladiopsis]|uniref:RXT2-like protein n=1 Tax=Microdochium trichocladiopsis TaxID=1682393 RepID=A0A9P8YFH2_9PEZI|nr:RXT2-like protein [Microdochium trichocladiopsis]KAH7040802.1 RXT2-like protein [Microdochium trichocladiopsis]
MAMKKAKKRRAYESESDSEIEHHGNRGQKFKKRSRFVHEGQLAPPSGPEMYREIINHAGYRRAIISRNMPLYDDDGYEIDSEEDDDRIQDLLDEAAEFDPYATVRLENILAPLTAVTDLPSHTTLSRPYTSKTLTELTTQGCNIMHKENAALWKIKHLQTRLIGDHTWVPCEAMLGDNDIDLFRHEYPEATVDAKSSIQLETTGTKNGVASDSGNHDGVEKPKQVNGSIEEKDTEDTTMADADDSAQNKGTVNGIEKPNDTDEVMNDSVTESEADKRPPQKKPDGHSENTQTVEPHTKADVTVNGAASTSARGDEVGSSIGRPATPDSLGQFDIHPFFLAPPSARPDRDLGIPEAEAEDVRRLLQLYVQKQEEVCRGAKRLYHGLLRAERMRKTVLQWAKYEAHVGPNGDMSDGEDWYDKEEWGLEDDLKKGQDEEEEDTTQPAKKRTRTHR